VGDVAFLGARDYAMRVWLDPDALATRGLSAADVVRALREQNVQVAAGQLGQEPVAGQVDFQVPITTLGPDRAARRCGPGGTRRQKRRHDQPARRP